MHGLVYEEYIIYGKTWTLDWIHELTDIRATDKAMNDDHDTYAPSGSEIGDRGQQMTQELLNEAYSAKAT